MFASILEAHFAQTRPFRDINLQFRVVDPVFVASEIPRIAMSAFSSHMRLAGVLTLAIGAMVWGPGLDGFSQFLSSSANMTTTHMYIYMYIYIYILISNMHLLYMCMCT